MTTSKKDCEAGLCKPRTFAEGLYHDVHHGKLAPKEVAEICGMRPALLLDAANPFRDDTQFQARRLGHFSRVQESFEGLNAICHDAGGVFVRLPERCPNQSMQPLFQHMTQLVGSFSKKLDVLRQHMSDGKVTVDEAMDVTAAGRALIQDVLAVMHAAEDAAGIPHSAEVTK